MEIYVTAVLPSDCQGRPRETNLLLHQIRVISQFLQKITQFLRCHDVGRAESQKHMITRTNTHAFTQNKHIYSTRINRHVYINKIRIHRHKQKHIYNTRIHRHTNRNIHIQKTDIRTKAFSHTQTRAPQAHHTYVIVRV